LVIRCECRADEDKLSLLTSTTFLDESFKTEAKEPNYQCRLNFIRPTTLNVMDNLGEVVGRKNMKVPNFLSSA